MGACRAGSRQPSPGWASRRWRGSGLEAAHENFQDDHRPATTRAAAPWFGRWLIGRGLHGDRLRHGQQVSDVGEVGLAAGAGEQLIMAQAVEALGQHVQQEAADEFRWGKRHGLVARGANLPVILVAEGDAARIRGAVGDGHPVGVAGQISQHGLRPGEERFGVDHPVLVAQRRQMAQKGAAYRRDTLHNQHPKQVSKRGGHSEPQSQRVTIGRRSPLKRGPYSMPIYTRAWNGRAAPE